MLLRVTPTVKGWEPLVHRFNLSNIWLFTLLTWNLRAVKASVTLALASLFRKKAQFVFRSWKINQFHNYSQNCTVQRPPLGLKNSCWQVVVVQGSLTVIKVLNANCIRWQMKWHNVVVTVKLSYYHCHEISSFEIITDSLVYRRKKMLYTYNYFLCYIACFLSNTFSRAASPELKGLSVVVNFRGWTTFSNFTLGS